MIDLDITDDYSMGYATLAGFRAGIADTFKFFDLEHDNVTNLNIHPFALMDGTMRDYLDLNIDESYEKAAKLIQEVKNVNGTFILLWHNMGQSLTSPETRAGRGLRRPSVRILISRGRWAAPSSEACRIIWEPR